MIRVAVDYEIHFRPSQLQAKLRGVLKISQDSFESRPVLCTRVLQELSKLAGHEGQIRTSAQNQVVKEPHSAPVVFS